MHKTLKEAFYKFVKSLEQLVLKNDYGGKEWEIVKIVANNGKQLKKCHFNLKGQNNEVSMTKNQNVAQRKKPTVT